MIYQYKYKFYLNASHYIIINKKKGETHSHCFELVLNVTSKKEGFFVKFNDVEHEVDRILSRYQDKLLNDVSPFDVITPTLENICEYFKTVFFKRFSELGFLLLTIEISETPSRSYILNVIDSVINSAEEGIDINSIANNQQFLSNINSDLFYVNSDTEDDIDDNFINKGKNILNKTLNNVLTIVRHKPK